MSSLFFIVCFFTMISTSTIRYFSAFEAIIALWCLNLLYFFFIFCLLILLRRNERNVRNVVKKWFEKISENQNGSGD